MNNILMYVEQWSEVLVRSFQNLSAGVIEFVPNLLVALLIFILGWILGSVIGKIVARLIETVKLDSALESAGMKDLLSRGGIKLNSGNFLGLLVKWFVIVTFLIAALDVLGLQEVNVFLKDVVLGYIPQVIVATLILLVSAVIADVMQKIVTGSAQAVGMETAKFFGGLTKWAIWVFAFIIALAQLGVARDFMFTLFTGFVAMLALAGGLAFGLGGKETAARFLEKIHRDIKRD